jgi:BRCT domain type II-containing protein
MAKNNESTPLWQIVSVMEVTNALKGKSFSITGHMGLPRAEIVKIIETAGGVFEERPRFGTYGLITNKQWNAGSTVDPKKSSKLIEAERNRIRIFSEAEFCQLIIDGGETMADNIAANGKSPIK